MKASVELVSAVRRSARVLQAASMFDVPLGAESVVRVEADLPLEEGAWNVGLVVGPSGSGKSALVKALWPEAVGAEYTWPEDSALLDAFPSGLTASQVTGCLTAVGLGSPPAWLRPYGSLSNGEAFRARMARSLAETEELVVVDEFTSVVDRQVARTVSHTVQKAVRRDGRQFVAVSCHYDIEDWLQPDWVYDVAAGVFAWRSVQPRPGIELRVHPVDRAVWPVFRRHHYLSGDLSSAARCFGGWIGGDLVAFASYLHFPHARTRNLKMAHRIVVLPDYQGLGIGTRMNDWLGQHLYGAGFRYHLATSHPSLVGYCRRSPRWRQLRRATSLHSSSRDASLRARALDPRSLAVWSFEYCGVLGAQVFESATL